MNTHPTAYLIAPSLRATPGAAAPVLDPSMTLPELVARYESAFADKHADGLRQVAAVREQQRDEAYGRFVRARDEYKSAAEALTQAERVHGTAVDAWQATQSSYKAPDAGRVEG